MDSNEVNIAMDDVNVELEDHKGEEIEDNDPSKTSVLSTPVEDEVPLKDLSFRQIIREYLPWISSVGVGVILVIVAVILFSTGGTNKLSLSEISMPSFQASIKVLSIDGKSLKYTKDLKYIGNLKARSLRQKIEPKLIKIYEDADLNIKTVLTLAFKFGGSGDSEVVSGRSTSTDGLNGIIVLHWIFLKTNQTPPVDQILLKMKTALKDAPDMKVDSNSISLIKLENITNVQTLTILSQYGFFKNGLRGLDMQVFAALSDGPNRFGIQTEGDEGLCLGLNKPSYGTIEPATCMDSKETYLGLLCTTTCDDGFEMEGSSLRSCMSSGMWSGQMASCKAICPPLSAPKLGSMHPSSCSFRNMSVGDICFMQCSPLSQLYLHDQGVSYLSHFRECLPSGKWSGEYGICKAQCPKLPEKPNQTILPSFCHTSPVEGDICTIQCLDGYVLDGGGSEYQLLCDVSGNWDHELLQCNRKCSEIVVYGNQSVTPSLCSKHPFAGIRCKFACDPGYELVGSEISTCMSDGSWSKNRPECIRTCSKPQNVENGIIQTINGTCNSDVSSGGSNCRISCDFGFVPTVSQLTCISSSGNWVQESATCQRFCDVLDEANGVWSPSTCSSIGHHIGYDGCNLLCSPAYSVIGSGFVQCNPDFGTWNSTPGFCGKRCSPLPVSSNMQIDPECTGFVDPFKTCTFSCDVGYIINGNKASSCLSNGLWSFNAPTCTRKRQFFIELISEQFSFCLGNSEKGDLIKYFNGSMGCSSMHRSYHWILFDVYNVQNSWSGMCIAASSGNLVKMEKCNSSDHNQNFVSYMQYTINTNTGYFLAPGHRTTSSLFTSIYPKNDVHWRFIDMSDSEVYTLHGARNNGSCLPLHAMLFTDFSGSCKIGVQDHNTVCSVICEQGYKLVELTGMVQCRNGAWNISENLCEPNGTYVVQCPPLNYTMMISPGTCLLSPQDVLSSCSMNCIGDNEYLEGPERKMCDQTGRWIPKETPICRTFCSALNPEDDTYYISAEASFCWNGKARSGDSCSFGCKDGFTLVGEPLLTCTDLGLWDNVEPVCSKFCDTIYLDANVIVVCDKDINGMYPDTTTCSFSCMEGFNIVGTNTSICSNGSWNMFDKPRCIAVCPPLSNFSDIQVEPEECQISSLPLGTECKLTCLDGFFLTSTMLKETSTLTCEMSHLWTGVAPQCVQACLPLDADGIDQIVQPPSCTSAPQPIGTVCTILCLQSTALDSNVVATCGKNGNWTSTGPLQCSHKCNALNIPNHAIVTPEKCSRGFVDKGTVCAIQCPKNMDTVGPAVRVCLGEIDINTGLRWSGVGNTICLPRCPPLPLPPATHVFPQHCSYRSMVNGDVCSFECKLDFNLNGPNVLECTDNGIWSNLVPTCVKFCPALQVTNGYMSCFQEISPYSPQGFMQIPGTVCTLNCDEGFAPTENNKLVCLNGGVWNHPPSCQQISGMFNILQKIENETVCLVVNPENLMVSLVNSSESCIASGNMGLWFWDENNLKHAGTGMCLSAKQIVTDEILEIKSCEVQALQQQWNCDAFKPYRIVIKDTGLGIDASYEVGPLLKPWTHAKSFWMTFNKDLETLASICSYKPSGICPALVGDHYVVEPSVCTSNQVEAWQSCVVTCQSNRGTTFTVQCLPTGVWSNVEDILCKDDCPPMTNTENQAYTPSSCSSKNMEHMSSCFLSCNSGTILSNGESQTTLICDDGKWSEEGVTCRPYCDTPPVKPDNVTVLCTDGTCKARCNAGFIAVGTVSVQTVVCHSNGSYNASISLKCERDVGHFMIQAYSATSLSATPLCLTVLQQNKTWLVVKAQCASQSYLQYWSWYENSLQNVYTGNCVSVSNTTSGSVIVALPCNNGVYQQWKCSSQHSPFHVTSQHFHGFIEFGDIQADTPIVFIKERPHASAQWVGVGSHLLPQTICSFRKTDICPALLIGPTMIIKPSQCETNSSNYLQSCEVSCKQGYESIENNNLICSVNGMWDIGLPTCLAKTPLNGFCPAVMLTTNLKVNSECLVGETVPSGTMCTFSCSPGYVLSGSKVLYCDVTGLWTEPIPSCKAFCRGLYRMPQSYILPSQCSSLQVDVGLTCTQHCMDGFESQEGNVVRTCEMDGTWSGKPANCQRFCPPLNVNNSMFADLEEKPLFETNCENKAQFQGDICIAMCEENYVLDGKAEVRCQADGKWNLEARCIPSFKCPEPMNNGVLSIQYSYAYKECVVSGTSVVITCQTGYRVDGDQFRVCQSNGSWSGDGPTVPKCVQNCPHLSNTFGMIQPLNCTDKHSTLGSVCVLQCPNGNVETKCLNSRWTIPQPLCSPSTPINISLVENKRRKFLVLTRQPFVGCLSIDENDTVIWIERTLCDPQEAQNMWYWVDENKIANLHQNKCIKAIPSNEMWNLGVGDCSNAFHIHCGDFQSSNQRMSVYLATNHKWKMDFTFNLTSALPHTIAVEKLSNNLDSVSIHLLDSLSLSGNDDVEYSESLDKPVCSYMCGDIISSVTKIGYISSPGYLNGKNYPANIQCEWLLLGYNEQITLTMIDLDLDEESDVLPCTSDCLEIYRGSNNAPHESELAAVYAGRTLSKYNSVSGGQSITSITGNMYVKFTSNRQTQNSGFAIKFEYNELQNLQHCGNLESNSTLVNSFSWVVSISISNPTTDKLEHVCSGVLLNSNTVLSAAHCMSSVSWNKSQPSNVYIVVRNSSHLFKNTKMKVKRIFVHPDYNRDMRSNNLALWKMSGESSTDKFPCLPNSKIPVHIPLKTCHAVGWIEKEYTTPHLMKQAMIIDSTSWCQHELGLTKNHRLLCGNYNQTITLSSKHSEPLFCAHNGGWYVVGVASHTQNGLKTTRRVYTSIYNERNWLLEISGIQL